MVNNFQNQSFRSTNVPDIIVGTTPAESADSGMDSGNTSQGKSYNYFYCIVSIRIEYLFIRPVVKPLK